jgi:hypothetical protein
MTLSPLSLHRALKGTKTTSVCHREDEAEQKSRVRFSCMMSDGRMSKMAFFDLLNGLTHTSLFCFLLSAFTIAFARLVFWLSELSPWFWATCTKQVFRSKIELKGVPRRGGNGIKPTEASERQS